MGREGARPGLGGLVVVDKAGGLTSHDVVGRMRKIAGTRRVGHAGTLDPMATGVLVLGTERATRMLGHLAVGDKCYEATIRLGVATDTDDAMGTPTSTADAARVTDAALAAGIVALTGAIAQVPSSISAIKVDGERAYKRVRAGEEIELAARAVTVSSFDVLDVRREPGIVDLDVRVECSTGTYVRALARDLGDGLGVGGHLTALRRTRVGPFGLDQARTLEQLSDELVLIPLAETARAIFASRDVDAEAANILVHGGWLPADMAGVEGVPGPTAVFGPAGEFLALVRTSGGRAKPVAVFGDDQ